MAMTVEQFSEMVERLEGEARKNPSGYKLRVALLAALGYAYILFILIVILALAALLGALILTGKGIVLLAKLAIPVVASLIIIVRALWVRIPKPEGIALSPRQAGPLFSEVDQFRRNVKGPKIHAILLTDDFNAAIAQVPRLGMFGWQKNYLIVGLPLMQAASPEQFRAILAHEFGHLSGSHGRFASWIYRVRRTWQQLLQAHEENQSRASFIYSKFFDWYAPFFAAYSFVLARSREYEADKLSAEIVGARQTADALILTCIYDHYLQLKFWPELYRLANDKSEPPSDTYSEMQRAFRAGVDQVGAEKAMNDALRLKTDADDTHPSLKDRLAALGEQPRLPALSDKTAAEYFFGKNLTGLTINLNQQWKNAVATAWRERYDYSQKAQHQLRELDEKAATDNLPEDDQWQRAVLTEEFRDSDQAMLLYEQILSSNGNHVGANFAIGRILLHKEEERGIDHIEKAMNLSPQCVLPGCEVIYGFLMRCGKEEQATAYFNRAERQAIDIDMAQQERAFLGFEDSYIPHELPVEKIQKLRQQLARYPEIAEAYLVRKQVKHFPEEKLYGLGLVVRSDWYKTRSEEEDAAYAQRIANAVEFEGETIVFVINSSTKKLKQIMVEIPGSQIYVA
jgi:Zn-dependent protease with chaperone function